MLDTVRNSFTIPIVRVLLILSTLTKSNGLIITLGIIENQNSSIVIGNFSDSTVLPILFPNSTFPFFANSLVVKSPIIHIELLSIKILYIVNLGLDLSSLYL